MSDLTNVENLASDLYSRSLKLKGAEEQLSLRKEDITSKVALDKRFVEIQPDVTEILDELQNAAHQRSVGAYEKMLTAIVDDVLGENGKKIAFEMKISRGVPSLFISIDNNGNTEDIIDGQGGSVANVVSTGLRYIALSRLQENRKFITLDEPDCWLSPEKIPAYFNVLNKLSKEIGIQSVVVSHHDRPSFGDASVVRVSVDEDDRTVMAENLSETEWNKEDTGIRKVRLFNYMSHEFTEFNLSSGVTVICGDNNIGKSAIVSALRAVAYNEGKDHMVKHGEDDCCVELFIENDLIVRWTRKRKGKDKTKYELLTTDGELLHEEFNGNEVPKWCEEALGIIKVNDIDVQISHQKVPMFMLSESPAKRAEILSMGKESQYLQKMIGLHKDDLRKSKSSIKTGEKDITAINNTLEALSGNDHLVNETKKLLEEIRKISKFKDKELKLENIISKIEKSNEFIENNKGVKSVSIPKLPEINEDCSKLSYMIDKLDRLSSLSKVTCDIEPPKVPDIKDCIGIMNIGKKIKALNDKIKLLDSIEHAKVPDLPDISKCDTVNLSKIIDKMESTIVHGKSLSSDRTGIIGKINDVDVEIEELIEESGGMCPLCGNELTEEHILDKKDEHAFESSPSIAKRGISS